MLIFFQIIFSSKKIKMDVTNQKILTNLDIPIQYLQSLYNISIDEINNENLEDYRKKYQYPRKYIRRILSV